MRYTIEGFDQAYACTLVREEETEDGKKKTVRIDCTDLVILRWFVDFYPCTKKVLDDGKEYAWLNHNKVLEELPLLGINRRSVIERMKKLVSFGILDYKYLHKEGSFSLYAFGDNYINLICSVKDYSSEKDDSEDSEQEEHPVKNTPPMCSQPTTPVQSTNTPLCSQPTTPCSVDQLTKDLLPYSSTSNTSTIRESKEEGEPQSVPDFPEKKFSGSFDRMIDEYSHDENIRNLLREWLKLRKQKKAAMTDAAIRYNLDALSGMASRSRMKIPSYLQEAIRRGWATFYEIPESEKPKDSNSYLTQSDYDGLFNRFPD